jgi:hypothetical protein
VFLNERNAKNQRIEGGGAEKNCQNFTVHVGKRLEVTDQRQ